MQVHGLSNSVLNLQHDIIPGIISICIILIKEIFRSLCLYGREINIYLNAGLTLEGDSGKEVALWLLTSLCTSAKREVEVAL